MTDAEFLKTLWGYYASAGRHDLPWRLPLPDGSFDPYRIVVSELMLQQTQVARVLPKFEEFLEQFPTVQALASTPLADVLIAWSGLGYNRRAKFLWQAAQMVVTVFDGILPDTLEGLACLPGIGPNTAGAIMAYVYNQPVIFLETNIRTVYIHHFFAYTDTVADAAIYERLAETLDHEKPREFYWALMDYGTYLKQMIGNVSQRSANYTKQSRFEGSRRQIRGQVLRLLAAGSLTETQLVTQIPDARLPNVLVDLMHEGLIHQIRGRYSL